MRNWWVEYTQNVWCISAVWPTMRHFVTAYSSRVDASSLFIDKYTVSYLTHKPLIMCLQPHTTSGSHLSRHDREMERSYRILEKARQKAPGCHATFVSTLPTCMLSALPMHESVLWNGFEKGKSRSLLRLKLQAWYEVIVTQSTKILTVFQGADMAMLLGW